MGLKWFDYVGHAAVGAMDKDAEIRKEQLDRRFKELDENKTMYRALATTRYSKDLDKFEEETKKYDTLKSVYADIENNNYDAYTAAMKILSAQDPDFKSLHEDIQQRMAKNVAKGFEKTYDENQKEIGFKVYHDELNIQAPQRGDYFKGPEFWSKLSDEIRSGTVGPLQEQIIKLFGSKHHPAEVNLGDNEAIKGTEIKDFIRENDAIKKAYYTSKNTDKTSGIGDGQIYAFGDGTASDIPSTLTNKYNSYTGVPSNDVVKAALSPINSMVKGDILRWVVNQENGQVEITGDGQDIYDQSEALLNQIVNERYFNIALADGYTRTDLIGNETAFSNAYLRESYKREWNSRVMQFSNKAIMGGGDVESLYVIPAHIMGIGNSLYHSYGIQKGDLEKHIQEWIQNEEGTIAVLRPQIDAIVQEYIQKNKVDVSVSGVSWNADDKTIDIRKGYYSSDNEKDKFLSNGGKLTIDSITKALENDEYVPLEILEIYNKHIEEQGSTEDTDSTTEDSDSTKTEIKKLNLNETKKEETIVPSFIGGEGIGNEPWLFSNGNFNPDWDSSDLDMDKKFVFGSDSNKYNREKNKYENKLKKEEGKQWFKDLFSSEKKIETKKKKKYNIKKKKLG